MPDVSVRSIGFFLLLLCMAPLGASADAVPTPAPDFERDVAPVLVHHCLECHHVGKKSGKLTLATEAGIQAGGEGGEAIVAGKPDESFLLERIVQGEMPPPEHGKARPLAKKDVDVLRRWIQSGAPWPKGRELGLHEKTVDLDQARKFWAFRPVQRPKVPVVRHADSVTNPIDAFVWEKLEAAGLEMAPPAEHRALLRRASLDVVGLPPTPEEQAAFAASTAPDAYERLVDRLLNHPGYGERWARHWLDLVRYADSNGYERDASKPSVWRYRDYVIDSFNTDKPYNRFVLEQIAGDELSDARAESIIATGFHALGTWQDEVDPLEAPQYRADELDDMIRTTSQTFLGITLGCARCHNHKFDPLTMVDYYSLAAILDPLKRPSAGRTDKDLPVGSPAEHALIRQRDASITEQERQIDVLRAPIAETWLTSGKSKLPPEAITAFQVAVNKRSSEQTKLVSKHSDQLRDEVTAALPAEVLSQISQHQAMIFKLRQETPDLPRAYYLVESTPKPRPTYLLLSGRASNPGPEMQPRVPAVLSPRQPEFSHPATPSSGRRLALARWMVDADNPLTARVIVNRVWQHHFGTGLVSTPSDFGEKGARPTHPELLDWLSHWFVHDAGWSLKKLHRLILTSQTYRLSSVREPSHDARDPENKLLAHYPYHRLEIEVIRDSMLAISGKLNAKMHGPAVQLPIEAEVIEAHTDKQSAWQESPAPEIYRRTIYAYTKRTLLVPMLEVFDLCDTTQSAELRNVTSIAPQALTLYNGAFANQQSGFFADRLEAEAAGDFEKQIERGFVLSLGRLPNLRETVRLRQFLVDETQRLREDEPKLSDEAARHRALTQVCRAIFNLNEFIYPE